MAKTKQKSVKRKEIESIETEPDAWERFTKAVHKVAPPKKPKAKGSQDK